MKIAQYIVEYLKSRGVRTLFGYIGGYNADILDFFCADKNNHFVLNYHEQASSFAVNTYAELTRSVGVATASGAPSFCNMVAGIANAYFDSHPCVFILGSAHSLAVRRDRTIRQNAFEEIDAVSMVKDITKYAVKVTNPENIRYEMEKSFHIAAEGRQGPVLIDIPYDILRMDVDVEEVRPYCASVVHCYDEIDFREVAVRLRGSRRPLFLIGGGAKSDNARLALRRLLDETGVPAVATLCGLDVLPHDHRCFCGFVGHYGNRYANLALKYCDCLFVLGARLDERQLGGFKTTLAANAVVVRVDVERAELNRRIKENLSYCCRVEDFLYGMLGMDLKGLDFLKWRSVISIWEGRYPSLAGDSLGVSALDFLDKLSGFLPHDAIICADVGQNQMYVAQALKLYGQRRLFNSGGYGSMGFSIPAAIGCAYAKKDVCIVSVNGDGGFQMNLQELQTIRRDGLAINIIVLNNRCLGMIRKTQEKLFNGRDFVSVDGYSVPDFELIAKAYDIPYMKVDSPGKYDEVRSFFSTSHSTFTEVMLPVIVENVPEPGSSVEKQTPELPDDEFRQIMRECMLYE